jgi:hypothetical protein
MPLTVGVSHRIYGEFLRLLLIMPLVKYRHLCEGSDLHYTFYSASDAADLYNAFERALYVGDDTFFPVDPVDILQLKFLLLGNRSGMTKHAQPYTCLMTLVCRFQAKTEEVRRGRPR